MILRGQKLTKETVLSKVSQEELMEMYLGIKPDTHGKYANPLREDHEPGCVFYYSGDNLYFHDFAKGWTWDCFNVVQEKYNINFYRALQRINRDYDLNFRPTRTKAARLAPPRQKFLMQIVPTKWTDETYAYWKEYKIYKKTLKKFNVYNVKNVWVDKRLYYRATTTNPIFGYVFPTTNRVKLYRPLSPDPSFKWRSNTSKQDIFGYEQLPKTGNLLLIVSSLKDLMVLDQLGYVGIAFQSEIGSLDSTLREELESRFKKIITIYDNDATGIEKAKSLGYEYIVPTLKDVADMAKDNYPRCKTYFFNLLNSTNESKI